MIRKLKSSDWINFFDYCQHRDIYHDFYITKNRNRLFLNDVTVAKRCFNDCIKHNDICYVVDDGKDFKGLLIIFGYSDKSPRKYIKVLADDLKNADKLFRILVWNLKTQLYLKIKKDNPISKIAKKYKFFIIGGRGKEFLFCKKPYRKDKKYGNSYHK